MDDENNYTYLTVREHIIAHFLLWKIYKNPNDLRSMKMLGANLTSFQRKTIGIYCRDNKLGIHGAAKKERKEWILKGIETQIKNKIGILDPKKIHKNASLGGITGSKIQIKNKIGIFDPKNIHKNASLGGKSLKGMICVTNGKHRTRIRPEKLEEFLSKGYNIGFKISS